MLKHTELTRGRIVAFLKTELQPRVFGERVPLKVEINENPRRNASGSRGGTLARGREGLSLRPGLHDVLVPPERTHPGIVRRADGRRVRRGGRRAHGVAGRQPVVRHRPPALRHGLDDGQLVRRAQRRPRRRGGRLPRSELHAQQRDAGRGQGAAARGHHGGRGGRGTGGGRSRRQGAGVRRRLRSEPHGDD